MDVKPDRNVNAWCGRHAMGTRRRGARWCTAQDDDARQDQLRAAGTAPARMRTRRTKSKSRSKSRSKQAEWGGVGGVGGASEERAKRAKRAPHAGAAPGSEPRGAHA